MPCLRQTVDRTVKDGINDVAAPEVWDAEPETIRFGIARTASVMLSW
jgi:hypothetical protein